MVQQSKRRRRQAELANALHQAHQADNQRAYSGSAGGAVVATYNANPAMAYNNAGMLQQPQANGMMAQPGMYQQQPGMVMQPA